MTSCVDRFVCAVKDAAFAASDVFAEDAQVDVTMPNWRFVVRGARAIRDEFAKWFGHPATFDDLRRTPLPDGELVEFMLVWTEHSVVHKSHQSHHLTVRNDEIVGDIVWCGGRWPASLLAEMNTPV